MSFKFSLLNLEKTDDCEESEYKMPKTKKSKSKKQTAHQKKFAKYSKICHKEPTKEKYYKCMSKNLKK